VKLSPDERRFARLHLASLALAAYLGALRRMGADEAEAAAKRWMESYAAYLARCSARE
jgi:hypothetical protein